MTSKHLHQQPGNNRVQREREREKEGEREKPINALEVEKRKSVRGQGVGFHRNTHKKNPQNGGKTS